jgi:glycosyltransferase involved in cell wall biosynthesis
MRDEPLISVIMPVFNGSRYVQDALRSVTAQSWQHLEAIVVDDGSTDDTERLVQDEADRDQRVRLLHHDRRANRGVSRSRRLALDHSRGRFIAFLDSDDVWRKDKLERQMQVLSDWPETVLCHTGVRFLNETESSPTLHLEAEFNFADELLRYPLHDQPWFGESNRICLSSVICRAEPLRRMARGFPQLFQYEDWTWWTLLSSEGSFAFLPGPLTSYRVHDASVTARLSEHPLREVFSRLEHWLTVAMHARDDALRELSMTKVAAALADAAACYAESRDPPGPVSKAELAALLDRAALLQRLGECEQELARLRRFLPRRLVGWWRRWRRKRLADE